MKVTKKSTKTNNNTIAFIVAAVFVLAGIIAILVSNRQNLDLRSDAKRTRGPSMSLNPSSSRVSAGATIPLNIILNTYGLSATAVEIHLAYDPNTLEITGFTPTSIMPVVLMPANMGGGSFSVILGVQPEHAYNGSVSVGTILVHALAPARASVLSFTQETRATALGQSTNILTGTSVAKIRIH